MNTFLRVVTGGGGEGLALVLVVVTLPFGNGLNIRAAALARVVVIATARKTLRALDFITVVSVRLLHGNWSA